MYSEKVMDHFQHPRNVGEIENASGVGTVGNAKCGDIMRIYLDIDDNGIIQDVKFKTFGCGAAVATSSMATELVKGKNIQQALAATNISVSMDKGYRMAYSNYLIEAVAKIINGNSYQMLAPQYVTSPEAKKVFMEEKSIKEVFDLAKSADIAVAGIGTLDHNSALTNAEFIPMEEFERLQKKGGTGEILSHVVDKDGKLVKDEFEEHLLSLDLEEFKKIPIRVGVAYGLDKKEAILGVLRGGYVNVLITDEKVANYLIEETK